MGSLSQPFPTQVTSQYSTAVTAQALNNWTKNNGTIPGRAIAWSPPLGILAVGASPINGSVATSADTLTWAFSGGLPNGAAGMVWADYLGLFVMVTGIGTVFWSPNGINWTVGAWAGHPNPASCIACSSKIVVAGGSGAIGYSVDGKTFTTANGVSPLYQYGAVTYSPKLGIFVALPGDVAAVNTVAHVSSDGITWKQYPMPAGLHVNVRQIAWCDALNLFIAANGYYGGVANQGQILASNNGAVWSVVSPQAAILPLFNLNSPWGAAWSADLGCVILTQNSAGAGQPSCWYSFDAKTWSTGAQLDLMGTWDIIYVPELAAFIATDPNNVGVWVSGIPTGKSDFIGINTGTIFSGLGYTGQKTSGLPVAGAIGQIITAETLAGAAVPLATGVTANIAQITLTPGEWDVSGNVDVSPAATTVLGNVQQGSSTVSATLGAQDTFSADTYQVVSTIDLSHVIPTQRYSVAANTTVYLVANATFTTSTCTGYGTIRARRVG